MKALYLLLLVSFNAMAVDWNALTKGRTYTLTQDFSLKQLERSGALLEFTKGEKLVFKEGVPLGAVPVMLYIFNYKNCPGPALATDMDLIPVNGTNPVVEVGAQVENCELNIYIENKDVASNSFFE